MGAENNKVVSAPKYAKKIDEKCRMVINAAKAHSHALQEFNQMLQQIYSQMEDENDPAMDNYLQSPQSQQQDNSKLTAGGNENEDEYAEADDTFDAEVDTYKSMHNH